MLARKSRPRTFSEVVGQKIVVRTLENALSRDRVPHGLIFSGIRGTGKTTLARIMAKAMNCEQGVTPTPCGKCNSCRDINGGTAVDLQEIDGASNRGIQEIRDLKERIRFMPISSRYKIIIIDEVHMLTTEAFNALLKTLEEPPDHVYFMFATTELHKVPVTILSRCQRYELQRVSHSELVRHFMRLAADEGFKIDQAAVDIIARESSGSVRDGLSLLDQVFSYCGNEVLAEEVAEVLGLVSHEVIADIGTALLVGDISLAMERLEQVYEHGLNSKRFTADLLVWFRNLVFCRLSKKPDKMLDLGEAELARLEKVAAQYTVETLSVTFKVLLEGLEKVHYASQPRLAMEMAFLQAVQAGDIQPVGELLSRLDMAIAGVSFDEIFSGVSLQVGKGEFSEKVGVEVDRPSLVEKNAPVASVRAGGVEETGGTETVQVGKVEDVASLERPGADPVAENVINPVGNKNREYTEKKQEFARGHGKPGQVIKKPVVEETEDIRSRWPGFIEYVKGRKPWMAAALQRAESAVISGGELIISYDDSIDCSMLKNREHAQLLTEFVLDFFQQPLVVSFDVNGGGECVGGGLDGADSPQDKRKALAGDSLVLTALEVFNGQVGSIRVEPRSFSLADMGSKKNNKVKKIAVVDIETTGFQNQGGLIVEIGIVGLDLETGHVTDEFESIVKENGFGEEHTTEPYGWIFKNSDLNYEDVLQASDLIKSLPEIQAIFDKYLLGITAFNKQFDFGFLKSRGLKITELPCIMLSSAPVVDLPPNPGFKDAKWPKVEEAWEHFFPNKAYKEAHRALDDARHEALITYELYKLGKFKIKAMN